MSENIHQVFIANPITTNAGTDLMYFGQSPYAPGNDAAMTFSNFKAQFGATFTASPLTEVNDTNVTLTLGGTPTTALLQAVSITVGWTGTLSPVRGGTGVNNGASTITLGGSLTTVGAFASTFTMTAATTVTFPTSGTLATTSQLPTLPLTLTNGGTSASLVASNGGIFYSTASAGAILAGTATANQVLLSGASTTPAWSTATYPPTTTINQLLYSSANNVVSGLATSTTAVLTTAAGVPTWAAELSLALGGTNAALVANNGGIFYSTASAGAILAGTSTAGLALLSGASAAPKWSVSPPITQIIIQSFAAGTSTYTPSAGMQYCNVEIWGPGGGSGGAAAGSGTVGASAGGGGGGYCRKLYTAALLGATAAVVVGTGGNGGTAGNNPGSAGSAASTFTPSGAGATLTANAGGGGAGSAASATLSLSGNAGNGGIATGGDVNIDGGDGMPGFVLSTAVGGIAGAGGASGLCPQINNPASGNAQAQQGTGYGNGAAGVNNYGGVNDVGAPGANGFCYIMEYCSK
jgi:hypothetical protein